MDNIYGKTKGTELEKTIAQLATGEAVCGFEYEGDFDSEPDDWKCPICGVVKAAFKEG